jgi:cytoplasmic iron level regulating protein YaaA (DUF328/UPF0246 family)
VILSGLYGVLRPLDLLQPYRLEMGTRLENAKGSNLYQFWGTQIADYLNERSVRKPSTVTPSRAHCRQPGISGILQGRGSQGAQGPVVECVFEDFKGGKYKIISFHAKRARGLMVRWAVQHKARKVADLRKFDLEGYALAEQASTPGKLVFRRKLQD